MSKAIALSRALSRNAIRSDDALRQLVVLGCALALILARQPLPFL